MVCPQCKQESQESLRLHHTIVWECPSSPCRLRFSAPQLNDTQLRAAYEKHYYPQSDNASVEIWENTPMVILQQVFASVIRQLDGVAGKSLLDYGCGKGNLCRLASELGMEVVGVEPDEAARSQAATRISNQVFAQLPDLQRAHPNRQFDLICLWDSIEHLRGPWTDLSALRSFLKPGGRLLITTPNAESLRARVLGRRWESYVNPTHFYYFTRTSLRAALAASGYTSIEELYYPVRYPGHGSLRRGCQRILQGLGLSGELVFVAQRTQAAKSLKSGVYPPSSAHGIRRPSNRLTA
jgi:2-polyprenyl-3-methyl-5-hydroxy-6-metoxy-1,4-benzoquinol methylase